MNTHIYNILINNILSCVQSVFKVCSIDNMMNTVRGVFKRTQGEHRVNTANKLDINIIHRGVFKVFSI